MKKILINSLLVLVLFPGVSVARERIKICSIEAFTDTFIDAGYSVREAKQNARNRCEKKYGESSMFCKTSKASCFESSIKSRW